MKEKWKSISGYEGIYTVSNHGRVKSLSRVVVSESGIGKGCSRLLPERILKQHRVGSGGYLAVGLHKKKIAITKTVHRLVFDAFVENPLGLPEVNHKDGNKDNCRDTNLEPATRQSNCQHAVETGLIKIRGEDNFFAKLNSKTVLKVRRLFAGGMSQRKIEIKTGIPIANVHCIVRRKSWKHLK